MTVGTATRAGALAGAIGASIMVLGQALLRSLVGIPMFPDLFEDAFTQAIPAPVFARVLDTLKFQAKPLLFVSLLVFQVVLGAVVGIVFARTRGRDPLVPGERWNGWNAAVRLALAFWLVFAILLLPLVGKGLFGAFADGGPVLLNLDLIASFLVFALVLAAICRRLVVGAEVAAPVETPGSVVATPTRRRLLGDVATAAFAAVSVGLAYSLVSAKKSPPTSGAASVGSPAAPAATPTQPAAAQPVANAPATTAAANPSPIVASSQPTATPAAAVGTPVAPVVEPVEWKIPGLVPEVSPTKDFYVVSKNFFSDPVVDASRWSLEITGLVKQPYHINNAALQNLPWQERYQTLECISNEVGGDLISNASWRGTSLRDIIAAAQPDPTATKVVFSAADGYTDSLTFDRAMSPANLLVYSMNGQPLEAGHGAPGRLLIPGIYGMKNVKWLTKVELVNTDVQGYWQQRGWSDQAFINTMSRIDTPTQKSGGVKPGTVELGGIAFGGDKGIGKVEISVDSGKTWRSTTLKEPLGPFTWRLWKLEWDATVGDYTVVVRATDGTGKLQTSETADTLPNGATGWHSVQVRVG